MQRFEQVVGKVVILFLISLATFFVCDAFLPRLIRSGPATNYQDLTNIFFAPKPYIVYRTEPTERMKREDGFNDAGFRGATPKVPKPEGEVRVIMLGGSTVLNGEPSLPALVEQALAAAGQPQVKVYNFGTVASITRMDLSRLVFSVGDVDPNLVLLYGGGNDVVMSYQGDPRPGYPPNFASYEFNPLLDLDGSSGSWGSIAAMILNKSRILRMIAGDAIGERLVHLQALRREQGFETPEWSKRIAEQYFADIELTAKVAAGLGAKTLAVFQPLVYFKRSRTDSEKVWAFPELTRHAETVREVVRGKISGRVSADVAWLDLSDIFAARNDEVFTDGIHIKQENFAEVAAKLSQFVSAHAPGGSASHN